ncbi:DEAD/DEAH box helicase [Mycolicibacterium conceptionense]|uniref:DEAD/DEAH box helicase n=1 Tax=Mycolicibacterium conceptionense TaxID=451644 RepID=UPI000A84EDCE|nr:DEAD/DEAH box helicase [Mycolicibacterium conceptionense]
MRTQTRGKTKTKKPAPPAPFFAAPRELREYQVQAADAVTSAHTRGVQGPAVVLPTGSGKSLAHSTLVPTSNGVRKHGDLRVGDRVFQPTGKTTTVTGVYPQGTIPVFRVEFSDGASVLASGDHLWQVRRGRRKPRVLSTDELVVLPDLNCWCVPMTAPVEYPQQEFPIDPFVLGYLIGSGYSRFSGMSVPGRRHIERIEEACSLRWFHGDRRPYVLLDDDGNDALCALDLHRVPEFCFTSSIRQRRDLLSGLIAASIDYRNALEADKNRRELQRPAEHTGCNYRTTRSGLADDVQRLVWSLGGTATATQVTWEQPAVSWDGAYVYPGSCTRRTETRLSITLPLSGRRNRRPHRSIVSIEPAGEAECQCISVDAEDGLYLVGEEHIVTHNTTVIAELVRREVVNGRRVLMMAHRNELIEQMADAVRAVNPAGPVPAKIGGPHRGDPDAQVVSATVQSLQKDEALARIGMRDLVIVDEAHHAPARTYRKVLDYFAALGGRRAGFTATMIRHSPMPGEPPLRSVWSEVVFERDITWAIENGFLLAPEGVTVELPDLDVSSIHSGSGDITDDEAAEAMMRETTLNATVEAVLTRTGHLSTIVFGASMEHCRQLAELLVNLGVSAEVVVGPTTVKERAGIYQRFRSGETRVLVTVDVLTEGADFPRCEAVVLARPTKSQSRLVQCVGRALRPHTFEDGRVKERALVVDLVGAGSLGLIVETALDPEDRRKRAEDEEGLGCACPQPCMGEACDFSCTGIGCDCECDCAGEETGGSGTETDTESDIPCTCSCSLAFGLCRCGCECDKHRIDPLQTFDPVSGTTIVASGPQRRGDASWSTRTATIRWARHPRGLVRSVYRQTGSKGVLMLADMRGVPGTVPGKDWAFGFYDTTVRRMYWVGTDGQWAEPGPQCYLQGMSLAEADEHANRIFPGHLRDGTRSEPSEAQVGLARAVGVPEPETLDRRDLSDMIALAQAEVWLPNFERPQPAVENAA